MSESDTDREFEIILWGATGYTGRLVAEYLRNAPSAAGLRWAIAGRDRAKLQAVHAQLGLGTEVGLVTGDAQVPVSLDAMCRRTRVICTTVGPYFRYGSELVAACVRAGTHSCDLTGEPHFVREMIDAHHGSAAARGVRIVHCCGFDSIPSDLGVLLLAEQLRARGRQLARADAFVGDMRGGLSGGSFASRFYAAEDTRREPALRKVVDDPYGLVPGGSGPDRGDDLGTPRYEPRLGCWTTPFPMALINTRVVRRSNALLGYAYGRDFKYSEQASLPRGPMGMLAAKTIAAGFAAFNAAVDVPALRRALQKRAPRPGQGPTAEQRAGGRFTLRVLGEAAPDGAANGLTLIATVSDRRDPGYGSTSVMLAESALSLARDATNGRAGVLTPSAAFGTALIERLKAAGQTWTVSELSN